MRSITLSDLEQKSQRYPDGFTLAIEKAPIDKDLDISTMTQEQLADLLEPSLRILTTHSNMKPHLDNGMNQNGIYYNADYFRLYLAFAQFQEAFAVLYPNEVIRDEDAQNGNQGNGANEPSSSGERDRDRDRNANMKAYRGWIEPLLTETNWAAFRRNIVVGERMVQLTKVVGQGVLLMTKELSGSKIHLTFTNNEWDEFINGLETGKWDHTIRWDLQASADSRLSERQRDESSLLVYELQQKFASCHWFREDGGVVSPEARRISLRNAANSNKG